MRGYFLSEVDATVRRGRKFKCQETGRMKAIRGGFAVLSCMIFLSLSHEAAAQQKVISRDVGVDGTTVHYLISPGFVTTYPETRTGHGPAVILLHGYAETSRMWTPIFPLLAEKFTVIAPDLPGIGDS